MTILLRTHTKQGMVEVLLDDKQGETVLEVFTARAQLLNPEGGNKIVEPWNIVTDSLGMGTQTLIDLHECMVGMAAFLKNVPDRDYSLSYHMFAYMFDLAITNNEALWIVRVDDKELASQTIYGPGTYFVGDVVALGNRADLADLGPGEYKLDDGAVVRMYALPTSGIRTIDDHDDNTFNCPTGMIGIIRCDYLSLETLQQLHDLDFEAQSRADGDEFDEPSGFTFFTATESFKVKNTVLTTNGEFDIECYVFNDIYIDHTFHPKK